MSEEEIIINDIKEIIPTFNNNIASFKQIVHKLERNYKANKQNIDYLKGNIDYLKDNINNIKEDLGSIDIDNICINIENLKIYTKSIKEELYERIDNESNLNEIELKNIFYKHTIDINTKFLIFTFVNITISAIVFFFK
jgi:uncharacterized protein (DUF342 family)